MLERDKLEREMGKILKKLILGRLFITDWVFFNEKMRFLYEILQANKQKKDPHTKNKGGKGVTKAIFEAETFGSGECFHNFYSLCRAVHDITCQNPWTGRTNSKRKRQREQKKEEDDDDRDNDDDDRDNDDNEDAKI